MIAGHDSQQSSINQVTNDMQTDVLLIIFVVDIWTCIVK